MRWCHVCCHASTIPISGKTLNGWKSNFFVWSNTETEKFLLWPTARLGLFCKPFKAVGYLAQNWEYRMLFSSFSWDPQAWLQRSPPFSLAACYQPPMGADWVRLGSAATSATQSSFSIYYHIMLQNMSIPVVEPIIITGKGLVNTWQIYACPMGIITGCPRGVCVFLRYTLPALHTNQSKKGLR